MIFLQHALPTEIPKEALENIIDCEKAPAAKAG